METQLSLLLTDSLAITADPVKSMPPQKPGRSKQDYATPADFLEAVKQRLGIDRFVQDLAASPENAVCKDFFTQEDDALTQSWQIGCEGWSWCNPPYTDISPWVKKAWMESQAGAKIAMLLPASPGANWFKEWVDRKACVLWLNGRLTFQGHSSPYPKDCMLLLYAPFLEGGSTVWRWRTNV